jgi:hypothetical protein
MNFEIWCCKLNIPGIKEIIQEIELGSTKTMKLPASNSGVSVLTDGLTRRLLHFRPKGWGINPADLNSKSNTV